MCDWAAAEFKTACRCSTTPVNPRSLESQAVNLQAYLAQTGPPHPVKGVSAASVYSGVPWEQRVPPVLHLDLGIGNKIKDLLRELLEKIGSKDPVAALRANELRDEIDCLAAVIDDSAGDLQNILDEHAAGDREDLGTRSR